MQFLSRKFLMTIVTVIVTLLGSFLAPEVVEQIKEVLVSIVGLVAMYIAGQSHVDAKKEIASGTSR